MVADRWISTNCCVTYEAKHKWEVSQDTCHYFPACTNWCHIDLLTCVPAFKIHTCSGHWSIVTDLFLRLKHIHHSRWHVTNGNLVGKAYNRSAASKTRVKNIRRAQISHRSNVSDVSVHGKAVPSKLLIWLDSLCCCASTGHISILSGDFHFSQTITS